MTGMAAERPGNALKGIGMKIASVAIFVAMSACIKGAGELPPGQVVFFRSFFALIPIMLFLAVRGRLAGAVRTTRPLNHIARGVVGVTAMGLGFFALGLLPLPEAITLNYAQPLLIVMFSALFMGEVVRAYRWSAVVIGFIGVFIIVWPKFTLLAGGDALGNREAIGVTAALIAAALSAVALLLVRNLVDTEKTATIVMWFSLTATVAGLLTLPFGWQALDAWQAALLVASGLCGGVAQLLMTESYRHAEVSTVAPFEYTSMIIGIVVGYLAFGDVPTAHMLVGGVIVIGSGLFIILRERALGLRRARTRRVQPMQQ